MSELDRKWDSLRSQLRDLGRVAIAYSGGVDSTFLLRVAADTLGPENVLALTAHSPVGTAAELDRAKRWAAEIGALHLVVESSEFSDPAFVANQPDRCYVCKKGRFSQLLGLARARGIHHLLDGTNADDAEDYRPGTRAAAELGVISPLLDAGFTKSDIRAASRSLALPSADLPSFACLASRIPYGTSLTEESLRRIEAGEEALAALGLKQYRLRHHGVIARIEVPAEDLARVLAERETVLGALRELGYRYVTLDLQGYRTGSLNEVLR